MKFYDSMGYVPGKLPLRPTSRNLGLTRMSYFGFNVATPTPNFVELEGITNCLPMNTDTFMDIETGIAKCARYFSPGPTAAPDRLQYQIAIAQTAQRLRASPRGRTCRFAPYASCLGAMNADNGATWLSMNQSACQTIFLEPVPGAPNGIGNLFEIKVVSVYVFYKDKSLQERNLIEKARLMRLLYPGQKICACVCPRFTGSDLGDRRLDYMTGAEFQNHLSVVTALFDEVILWDSALYGVAGTTWSQRNPSTGYALAGPNGWDANAEWWQVAKQYISVPVIPNPGGGVHQGPGGAVP